MLRSCWKNAAWRPADSIILELVGKPLEKQYAMVTGQPAEGRQYHNFHKIYADYRDAHAVAVTSVLPAVRETLNALHVRQFRLAVVSTGAASRLEAVLAAHNLRRYIEMVEAGAGDKADGIRRVMSALGVPSSRTAYVGDHPDDAGAAREAGVLFFAVATGAHRKGDFGSATVLGSLSGLPAALDREWLSQ
jgi:phosphoglycolate phosphatase